MAPTNGYEITLSFFDDGQIMVQAHGTPYPLALYKETGFDLERLLAEARDAIVRHRSRSQR